MVRLDISGSRTASCLALRFHLFIAVVRLTVIEAGCALALCISIRYRGGPSHRIIDAHRAPHCYSTSLSWVVVRLTLFSGRPPSLVSIRFHRGRLSHEVEWSEIGASSNQVSIRFHRGGPSHSVQ